jgi:membrane fusion protein (multidrug efflux system)
MAEKETDKPGSDPAVTGQLRNLLDEQRRLSVEIERLIEQERNRDGRSVADRPLADETPAEEEKEQPPREKDLERKPQTPTEPAKKPGGEKEAQEQPKPPFRRRAAGWVHTHPIETMLGLVALVVVLVGGYLLLQYLASYENTDDAQVDGHTDPIGSRISGMVIGVYTENNRSVVKNQTLVDLDPRDFMSALNQAQANLAQAQAALKAEAPNVPITVTSVATNVIAARLDVANGEAALDAARHDYQSAVAQLRQAEADAGNAAVEEQRYRRLADKEEVSRELYDQRATEAAAQHALVDARRSSADSAAKTVDQRRAVLDQSRERLRETESNQPRQIAVQRSTVATRQANVAAAAAQAQQAWLNLSYCKILAPVAGNVGDKTVEVGQQVAPGQELLAITQTDDIWVTANFKETQIEYMRPGQPVDISVDAVGQTFRGFVQNMPGATGATYSLLPPENATGNYVKVVQRLPVRIRFKPGQRGLERLRPGMSVEPKVWVR